MSERGRLSVANAVVEAHPNHGTTTTPAVSTIPTDIEQTARPDGMAPYVSHIANPKSEATVPMALGDFLIGAEVTPSLRTGEQRIGILDGEPVGAPQASPTWQLTDFFRGAHRLQIVRVVEAAEAQSESTEHTVYVIRTTVNR